ncbi:MAG TPA: hypothetical protein VF252_03900 [Gemmatimonadales bacterium]
MTASTDRQPWMVSQQDFPSHLPVAAQLRYLLQYAILAPSSKNTQPWHFSVAGDTIGLFADLTRWHPIADCGRRELYISLGCALENLLVASEQFGFGHSVNYFPRQRNEELVATVVLHPGGSPCACRSGISLATMIDRRTQHGRYRQTSIDEAIRRRLLACSRILGVRIDLTEDRSIRRRVMELNLHADEMEFASPEFRLELGHWLGEGGNGSPRLLARLAGRLVARFDVGRVVGKINAAKLARGPLVGLISSRVDDRVSQLKAGQALERLWLHATRFELGLQPMSQALEVPSLRLELAQVIPGGGWVPQQVFRLGYPVHATGGHTSRRPLSQVLLD